MDEQEGTWENGPAYIVSMNWACLGNVQGAAREAAFFFT